MFSDPKIRKFGADLKGKNTITNELVGHFSGKKSIPFIKEILNRTKPADPFYDLLKVRLTHKKLSVDDNKYNTPMTVFFLLAKFDEAIKPLRKACHW